MKAFFTKIWDGIKAFSKGIGQLFQNKAGQVSAEEVLKVAAGAVGVYLGYRFFFGSFPDAARPYFFQAEGLLWGYALVQGIAHNVTGQ